MNNVRAASLGLFLMMGIGGPAAAQGSDESGIYLGGSLGYAQYKDTCKNLVVACDDHDTAWRFFAGYQFNRNWSAEFGYGDLGDATGQGVTNLGTAGQFKRQSYAFDLSALGTVRIAGGLGVFGRLGLYMARTTFDSEIPPTVDSHEAGTNSGFTYGAGLSYMLGHFGLRAEWQRYANIGGHSTGTLENGSGTDQVDAFSLGALLRF
jgi:OmpA-OmpF porin, OOP family